MINLTVQNLAQNWQLGFVG